MKSLKLKLWMTAILILTLNLTLSTVVLADEVKTGLPSNRQVEETSDIQSAHKALQLSATVAATASSYYVEVPSDIQFGTILNNQDNTLDYNITVEANQLSDSESITVSSDNSIILTGKNNESFVPCYNDFTTQSFQKSAHVPATLTIFQEDAIKAAKGNYSGILHFQITYENSSSITPDLPQDTSDIKVGSVTINKSGISQASVSGLTEYAKEKKEGAYEFTIKTADSNNCKDGISSIASLISVGGEIGTTSYYDFSLICKSKNVSTDTIISSEIHDLDKNVLEIRIPLNTTNVSDAIAYRYHNQNTSIMQKLSSRPSNNYTDNTYYCDITNGYMYFYTSKLSVFAIHKIKASSATTTTVSTSILDVDTETNFTASLSMRKSSDFSSVSMCNPLFYEKADLLINGDTTKLTLYVINPIPNYASEGTPLNNVTFSYNGTTYTADISTTNNVIKSYPAASGFISSDGNYDSSPITVTLPTEAIKNTADAKLTCSAYVNAVMKSTQNFYVVLSNFEKGSTVSAASVTKNSTAKTVTSNSLNKTDGIYQIPVSAIKENSDDYSMMNDYMYPYADLSIKGTLYTLTLYIQHTVAGIEAGGPKYLKYESIQAVKTENTVTHNNEAYDSFSIQLTDTIPNPMTVTMFINAMNIEVKARLVFALEQIVPKTDADDTITASNSVTKTVTQNSVSSTTKKSNSGSVSKKDTETNVQKDNNITSLTDTKALDDIPIAKSAAPTESASAPVTCGYLLVTNAFNSIFIYIELTLLGVIIYFQIIIKRKNNEV